MSFDTNTDRCWRIVLPNGEDWDPGDGVPHFDSEKAAQGRLGEAPPGTNAVQFDAPCVLVTCNDCGADPGNDEIFAETHCCDMEEARKLARESDWTVTPGDEMYCWDCPVPEAVSSDA
jgi:hypothetical protein